MATAGIALLCIGICRPALQEPGLLVGGRWLKAYREQLVGCEVATDDVQNIAIPGFNNAGEAGVSRVTFPELITVGESHRDQNPIAGFWNPWSAAPQHPLAKTANTRRPRAGRERRAIDENGAVPKNLRHGIHIYNWSICGGGIAKLDRDCGPRASLPLRRIHRDASVEPSTLRDLRRLNIIVDGLTRQAVRLDHECQSNEHRSSSYKLGPKPYVLAARRAQMALLAFGCTGLPAAVIGWYGGHLRWGRRVATALGIGAAVAAACFVWLYAAFMIAVSHGETLIQR